MPGPVLAFHVRREGVHRKYRWDRTTGSEASQLVIDSVVVGPEKLFRPIMARRLAQAGVARNDRAVTGFGDRARLPWAPVGIDKQPRIAGQHRRRVQPCRQRPSDRSSADVPGYVPVQFRIGEASPLTASGSLLLA